jgi:enoyl-[acyl-carrier protein] reductase III
MLHEGKTVLITGGSRGLGRALALEFARQGAHVALTYLTEARLAEEVVNDVRRCGVKGFAIQADLSDPDCARLIFEAVSARTDGIDVLIANAATGVFEPLANAKVKHWQKILSTNALSLILLEQAFQRCLSERRGSVLAISSAGAVRALPNYGLIGASKAALEAIVRHLALELGPCGVRVNAIVPGLMETDVLSLFGDRDRIVDEATRRTPLGRIVTPEDVAPVASFLASAAARGIHGQVINVDAGYSAVG